MGVWRTECRGKARDSIPGRMSSEEWDFRSRPAKVLARHLRRRRRPHWLPLGTTVLRITVRGSSRGQEDGYP